MSADRRYPWGVDITGWARPDGFVPRISVLCPECAETDPWAAEAAEGVPFTPAGWDSLEGPCVACGALWRDWDVDLQAVDWDTL